MADNEQTQQAQPQNNAEKLINSLDSSVISATPDELQNPAGQQPAEDTSGIKLDMSKSVPVQQPTEQQSEIKLDLSKSIPVKDEAPAPKEEPWYKQYAGAFNATLTGSENLHELYTKAKKWIDEPTDPKLGRFAGYAKVGELVENLAKDAWEGQKHETQTGSKTVNDPNASAFEKAGGVVRYIQGGIPLLGPLFGSIEDHLAAGEYSKAAGMASTIVIPHIMEHFGPTMAAKVDNAVNASKNAQIAFDARSKEAKIAADQADTAAKAAEQARADHAEGKIPDAQRIQAEDTASAAIANSARAQKAVEAAQQAKADAAFSFDKLKRKVTGAAEKARTKEYEATASDVQKGKDLFQKAVPSKGANKYTDVDYDIARAHLEEAKAKGQSVKDLPETYAALESARDGISNQLDPYIEKYKDEPLVSKPEDSPKIKVAQKLAEMAKVDGNFADAMDSLSDFNITDPTVSEARDIITKLNNYQRSAMKSANNWDIYNMIETKPDFAARYFLAEELRDALHDNLEGHGVEGARDARSEQASLIRVRDAVGAQIRANRGGTAVRGSGEQGKMRGLVAKLVQKGGRVLGAGAGAEVAGVPGAIAGAALGETALDPLANLISARDMTRDEHIEKSMKYKGTNRKPVKIKGEGTPANIPNDIVPPAPKDVPESIQLTPRENTELHAELAAHYGESNLTDSTYQELEDQLRADVAAASKNGKELTNSEKSLLVKILKADSADNASRSLASKPMAKVEVPVGKTEIEAAQKKAEQTKIQALDRAKGITTETKNTLDVNPTLDRLGRGDESALVSHPIAENSRAHSPALPIPGLPEGLSTEMAHAHEWAHLALGAIDGLEPVDYISDMHPESEKGTAAQTRFSVEALKDEKGNIDPDKLLTQETQLLTKRMAGPAAHEVFDNVPYEEVKKMSNARGDFRGARQLVRDLHPEFTPTQVEAAVEAAYLRAKDFLSNKGVADRIRANAAVREDNLPLTHHASAGRVAKFAEDIRKVVNGEDNDSNIEPNGGGAEKGGEKAESSGKESTGKPEPATESAEKEKNAKGDRGGSEGDARSTAGESSNAGGRTTVNEVDKEEQTRIPPERSTGNPENDEAIRKGGALPGGVMKGDPSINLPELTMFHDPKTGTTLALKTMEGITPEKVAEKIKASRAQYEKFGNLEGEKQVSTQNVAEGANDFNKERGRPEINASGITHNPEVAKRIADEYDKLQHNPNDPAVKKSYDAAVKDINDQWDYAQDKMGIKFEPWTKEGQPYANSKEMAADVKNNGHLYFFQGGDIPADHPLAAVDPKTGLSYNDKLRAVHDLFGHAAHEYQFGPKGEENAWNVHRQMFSPEAIPAITTETRGQNSWVNFGGHLRTPEGNIPAKGEAGYVPPQNRPFAEQKAGVLPEEFHSPNASKTPTTPEGSWARNVVNNLEKEPAGGINPNNPDAPSKRYGFEILPEVRKPLDKVPGEQDFTDYANSPEVKSALEKHPDIKLGWDTTGEKPELNIGASTDDLAKAKDMARKLDQRALWDNEKQEVIPVGGTGEKTAFPEYPFEQRLNDLGAKQAGESQTKTPKEDESFRFGENVKGTPDQQKGLISTALPAGKKAVANPLTEDVHVGLHSLTPKTTETIADLVKDMPGFKFAKNIKDPEKVVGKYIDQFKDNLIDVYNQVPAEKRAATAKWYESANKLASDLATKFGKTDKQGAGVLAALSPQKDWDMSVGLAERVFDTRHNQNDARIDEKMRDKIGSLVGEKMTDEEGNVTQRNAKLAQLVDDIGDKSLGELTDPVEKAAFIRLYDEAHNPRDYYRIDPGTGDKMEAVRTDKGKNKKIAWGSLNEIAKAVSILEDGSRENISNNLGEAHKVRNFYNNILDPNNPAGHVTVDTHAVAAGHQRPLSGFDEEVKKNFRGISAKETGLKGMYAVNAEAYRQAANQLGLQPRQLQSIVWEAIREQFPDEFKRVEKNKTEIDGIWNRYKNGEISQKQAQDLVRSYSTKAWEEMKDKKPQSSRQAGFDWENMLLPTTKYVNLSPRGNESVMAGGLDKLAGK